MLSCLRLNLAFDFNMRPSRVTCIWVAGFTNQEYYRAINGSTLGLRYDEDLQSFGWVNGVVEVSEAIITVGLP